MKCVVGVIVVYRVNEDDSYSLMMECERFENSIDYRDNWAGWIVSCGVVTE